MANTKEVIRKKKEKKQNKIKMHFQAGYRLHKPLGNPMKYKSTPEFNHNFHQKARQLQPKTPGHRDMKPPLWPWATLQDQAADSSVRVKECSLQAGTVDAKGYG